MKTQAFFLLWCMTCLSGLAQSYRITFTGTGDANRIDWIKATNLRSNESITIRGTETLRIDEYIQHEVSGMKSAGIDNETPSLETRPGLLYPNPFQGNTSLLVNVASSQRVCVAVRNLSGQLVAQTAADVQAGGNEFSISVAQAGIYLISTTTDQGTRGIKAICSNPSGSDNTVTFRGASGLTDQDVFGSGIKADKVKKTLKMMKGDIILYECKSGNLTTLLAESPKASKNLDIEFVKCADPDGKNYPVTRIGSQTWMAANLAYLPKVDLPVEGSISKPDYYVYGFKENNVRKAKATVNYNEYGVLYNWEAARTSCPDGWRLPTDAEWRILEKSLGMSTEETRQEGWRHSGDVGCRLKEAGTDHWRTASQDMGNLTAFNARPGGYAPVAASGLDGGKSGFATDGTDLVGYARLRLCSFFWSSSELDAVSAWNRRLGCTENGVERRPGIKSFGYSVRCVRDVLVDDVVIDH